MQHWKPLGQLRWRAHLPHLALPGACSSPARSRCAQNSHRGRDQQQAGGQNEAVCLVAVACLQQLEERIHFEPRELEHGLAQHRMGENSRHSLDLGSEIHDTATSRSEPRGWVLFEPAHKRPGRAKLPTPRRPLTPLPEFHKKKIPTAAESQHTWGTDDSGNVDELLSSQAEPPPDARYLYGGQTSPSHQPERATGDAG